MGVKERYKISSLLYKMEQHKEYCDRIGLYNTSKYNGQKLNELDDLNKSNITIKIKPSN